MEILDKISEFCGLFRMLKVIGTVLIIGVIPYFIANGRRFKRRQKGKVTIKTKIWRAAHALGLAATLLLNVFVFVKLEKFFTPAVTKILTTEKGGALFESGMQTICSIEDGGISFGVGTSLGPLLVATFEHELTTAEFLLAELVTFGLQWSGFITVFLVVGVVWGWVNQDVTEENEGFEVNWRTPFEHEPVMTVYMLLMLGLWVLMVMTSPGAQVDQKTDPDHSAETKLGEDIEVEATPKPKQDELREKARRRFRKAKKAWDQL